MLSLIIPVYGNERDVHPLVDAIEGVARDCPMPFEAVFVVDGSPDQSFQRLRDRLPQAAFASTLVSLSRNFGAFNAVRCGMEVAAGEYMVVMAADLQDPFDLPMRFLETLTRGDVDIAFGVLSDRDDHWLDVLTSRTFWSLYRRFVLPELPRGGVHSFACTRRVRDRLMELREPTVNLAAQLFWLGFRRAFVTYERQRRMRGRSGWTLAKKLAYAFDSLFSFTDLPIRFLLLVGVLGTLSASIYAILLLAAALMGRIAVPGYAPTVLVVTFFGSITSLGLGIVGEYVWLILRTTRARPAYIVEWRETFGAGAGGGGLSPHVQ
jgi:polyisoprenyl-phosphate glycosyltransferase